MSDTETTPAPPVPSGSASPPDTNDNRARFRRGSMIGFVIGALLLIIGGVAYYFSTVGQESTDDAAIDGHAITIAPKVSGYVMALNIADNQRVKAGDLLLTMDARDFVVARDQARAALALAQAQLSAAETNLAVTRIQAPAKLQAAKAELESTIASRDLASLQAHRLHAVDQRATTAQTVDQASEQSRAASAAVQAQEAQVQIAGAVAEAIASAEAQVHQWQAQVQSAEAQLAQAQLNLDYTQIRAPADGWVTKRSVEAGNYIQPGQALLSLVEPDVWVIGNFKESQLEHMRPGQHVAIRIDAYPDLRVEGHVDGIQMGTGARFSLFPAENATGNFVKIVQRVPVKIVIDRGLDPNRPLLLGLSVVPIVDVQ